MITEEMMLSYLQELLDEYMEDKDQFGKDDRIVKERLHGMIACKEMVECLIGQPVNLQMDGKVTVGF